MDFIVKNTVAPSGIISNLYVKGLTEDVWRVSFTEVPDVRYVLTGGWGTTEEEAFKLLLRQIEKEMRTLSKNPDPRPSQVRRLDLLNRALNSI